MQFVRYIEISHPHTCAEHGVCCQLNETHRSAAHNKICLLLQSINWLDTNEVFECCTSFDHVNLYRLYSLYHDRILATTIIKYSHMDKLCNKRVI